MNPNTYTMGLCVGCYYGGWSVENSGSNKEVTPGPPSQLGSMCAVSKLTGCVGGVYILVYLSFLPFLFCINTAQGIWSEPVLNVRQPYTSVCVHTALFLYGSRRLFWTQSLRFITGNCPSYHNFLRSVQILVWVITFCAGCCYTRGVGILLVKHIAWFTQGK